MRIYARLVTASLAMIIIPVLLISYIVSYNSKRSLEEEIFRKLEAVADLKVRELETFFAERNADLTILANRPSIIGPLAVLARFAGDRSNPLYREAEKALALQIDAFISAYHYANVTLFDDEGTMLYMADQRHGPLSAHALLDRYRDIRFQKAKDGVLSERVVATACEDHPFVTWLAGPIYAQTGEVAGFILFEMDMRLLNHIIGDNTGMGTTGESVVVEKIPGERIIFLTPLRHAPHVVLRKTVRLGATEAVPAQKAALGEAGSGISIDYAGTKVLSVWRPIASLGWGLVAKIDEREAFMPVRRLDMLIRAIIAMTLLLTIVTVMVVAKSISAPIHVLCKGTEIIGNGDLRHTVGNDAKDEIGELSRAFDRMTERLRLTTTSVENLNREVAERRRIEEILRQSEEKYRVLYESSRDAIMIIEPPSWKFVAANPATITLFGAQKESEVLAVEPWKLSPERQPDGRTSVEKARELIEITMRDGASSFEWTHQRFDGRVFFAAVLMTRMVLGGKTMLQATVRDITERKEAEERIGRQTQELTVALQEAVKSREILTSMLDDNNQIRDRLEESIEAVRRAQNALVQSEKMAALGKFVADISHEVNNPLMIISGNAQLSLMPEATGERIRKSLQVILKECWRAKGIIRRLLRFARPSAGTAKAVDITKSIEAVAGIIEDQFRLAGIEVRREYGDDLPPVVVEEQLIQEVFINLMHNARDAMPHGGVITLRTSLEKGRLRIDIADTGCGMSEEVRRRVCEPYFTTKKGGTGLGTAICYGTIKAYGGELRYASEVHKGTVATVLLPVGGGGLAV